MRKILILLLLNIAAFTTVWAQESFFIKGSIKGMSSGNVVLIRFTNKDKIQKDSIQIKDGMFSFKGIVESPCIAHLIINGDARRKGVFFIENLPIDVQVEVTESDKKFEIKGSKLNDEYLEITKHCDEQKENQKGYIECQKNLVYKNASSIFAPQIIQSSLVYVLEYEELKELVSALKDDATKTYQYEQLEQRMKDLELVAIGKPAPYLELPNQEGKLVGFKELFEKNKYVLIDFWASWCGPCRKENPNIVKAYKEFHEKGFDIFAVSFDKDKEKWQNAIKQDELTWTHVSELKMWDNKAAKLYFVNSIPANVLINNEGIIIARNLHGEELMKKLEELLGHQELKPVYEIGH